jgi:hypothetical protein
MRARLLAVLLAGLVPGALSAAEPAPASAAPAKPPAAAAKPAAAAPPASEAEVDMELLEFLGSLDVEDKDWREYLEERPINKPTAKPEGQQVKSK